MKILKVVFLVVFASLFSMNIFSQEVCGIIKGKVFDTETQQYLEGASIVILENQSLSTITNTSGKFRIEKLPVGRYTLHINYLGYQGTVVKEILVGSAKDIVLNIGLQEKATKLSEVIVKAKKRKDDPINSMVLASSKSFTVEQTRRYAGGVDDPARMASGFAGVTQSTNVGDNRIVVRGNSPKGIVWRLDGVEIPNPNHFGQVGGSGGGVTVFSGQMLSNSDFYSSAFSAEYGNGLAAVFDMKLRSGNNDKFEHTAQIGLQGIDISSEGPLSGKNGASYLFNYRYSLLGLVGAAIYHDEGTVNEFPVYQDLSFKLNFPTKKAGTFTLFGIGGIGSLQNEPVADSLEWNYAYDAFKEKFNTSMGAASLSNLFMLSDRSYVKTSLVASGNLFDIYQDFSIPHLSNGFYVSDIEYSETNYAFSSVLNHKFNRKISSRSGLVFNHKSFSSDVNVALTPSKELTELLSNKGSTNLIRGFTQAKYSISDKLIANAGIHFMYLALNNNYSLEPRLSMRWNYSNNQSLSFGYGNHAQMESLGIYFSEIQRQNGTKGKLNKSLGFSRANHFVLGWDWYLSDKVHLKIEPYYQQLYNIPVKPGSSASLINLTEGFVSDSLENSGSGQNTGIDITFERFLSNNFYYMFTTSIYDSKYKGGDRIERNTKFNGHYAVNALFGKEFIFKKKNILGVNGRVYFMGGDYYTPVLENQSLAQEMTIYDINKPYSAKLGDFYGIDLTITYRINKKKYSSIWALQIKNVLNSRPETIPYYDNITNNIESTPVAGILPFLSYKLQF